MFTFREPSFFGLFGIKHPTLKPAPNRKRAPKVPLTMRFVTAPAAPHETQSPIARRRPPQLNGPVRTPEKAGMRMSARMADDFYPEYTTPPQHTAYKDRGRGINRRRERLAKTLRDLAHLD